MVADSFVSKQDRTVVFYESPQRILDTLGECVDKFGGDRKVAVLRELTKVYETVRCSYCVVYEDDNHCIIGTDWNVAGNC